MISSSDNVIDILDKICLIIVGETYRKVVIPESKTIYKTTIEFAKEKGYYVYYAENVDNKAILPYYLDNSCLKASKQDKQDKSDKPIVDKQVADKTTIEPKTEQVEQIQQTPKPATINTEINIFSEEDTGMTCPKCGKECTSKSGLTLHMKRCQGA